MRREPRTGDGGRPAAAHRLRQRRRRETARLQRVNFCFHFYFLPFWQRRFQKWRQNGILEMAHNQVSMASTGLSTGSNGLYWVRMGCHGLNLPLMGLIGFLWVKLDFRKQNGILEMACNQVSMGSTGLSTGSNGLYWVRMGCHGLNGPLMGLIGFLWVQLDFRKL